MRTLRAALAVLLVASFAAGAWGQAARTRPAAPAQPVLNLIPAGTRGFVVVNNVQKTTGNLDKFLANIGQGDLFGGMPSVLWVVGLARLGANFNPNGGFALTMLDAQKLGVEAPAATAAAGEAAAKPKVKAPKLPYVLFVSVKEGGEVADVFAKYRMAAEGEYTRVMLRMGEVYARKLGGYIILSPMTKALDAVVQAKDKAADEISKADMEMIAASDLAFHSTTKPGEAGQKGMFSAQDIVDYVDIALALRGRPPLNAFQAVFIKSYLTAQETLAPHTQSITGRLRFAPTGLMFEEKSTYRGESPMAKVLAALTPPAKPPLDRLPNLSYALAAGKMGVSDSQREATGKLLTDILDSLFKEEELESVPVEVKAKLKQVALAMNEQVSCRQVVVGGAPAGSGTLGAACVLQCKDADALKGLIAQSLPPLQSVIRLLGEEDENVQNVKLAYQKEAETLGSVKADAITVSCPKWTDMKGEEQARMVKLLGEKEVRFLVASADKNTVVITLGGGKAFMGEALKAAADGGTILQAEGVAGAIKLLPQDPMTVMLLNAGNLSDLRAKGPKESKPEAAKPEAATQPAKITCQTPVVMGAAVKDSSVHLVVHVPNDLLKEVVPSLLDMLAPEEETQPPSQPAPPAEGKKDF